MLGRTDGTIDRPIHRGGRGPGRCRSAAPCRSRAGTPGAGRHSLASAPRHDVVAVHDLRRSEEHTSELQSLMRISYAVFCLKKKNTNKIQYNNNKTTTRRERIYEID